MRKITELLREYDNVWFYIAEPYQEFFYMELLEVDAHFLNGSKVTPESIGDIVGVHSDGTIGCISYFVWYNSFINSETPLKVDYIKYRDGEAEFVITSPNINPV